MDDKPKSRVLEIIDAIRAYEQDDSDGYGPKYRQHRINVLERELAEALHDAIRYSGRW